VRHAAAAADEKQVIQGFGALPSAPLCAATDMIAGAASGVGGRCGDGGSGRISERLTTLRTLTLTTVLPCAGEDIISAVGAEVDRIETEIQAINPGIRYVDLETDRGQVGNINTIFIRSSTMQNCRAASSSQVDCGRSAAARWATRYRKPGKSCPILTTQLLSIYLRNTCAHDGCTLGAVLVVRSEALC